MVIFLKSVRAEYNLLIVLLWIQFMTFSTVEPSPLFFATPFTTRAPNEELDNVSDYKSSTPQTGERSISMQPTIYQQIARNALQRIVSPVVSHFILTTATQSSRIVSAIPFGTTTRKSSAVKRKMKGKIETLDEIPEEEITTKATEDEERNKEDTNPFLIKTNPSFTRDSDSDKPERLVLNLNYQLPKENVASEVDDLSKTPKDGSPGKDDDAVNEVEPIGRRNNDDDPVIIRFPGDSEEEDDDDETAPEVTTPKTRARSRNFSENGLIYVLEILGTIYTLGMGLVSTFLQSSMNAGRDS